MEDNNKEEKDLKKRKIILLSGILFLVLVLIGSSFAFFTYFKTSEAFTLSSAGIEAKFEAGTNKITLSNAYPLTDDYAIENLDRLSYIDFTVSGNITSGGTETVNYEIYLTEDSSNTLDSNYIKLYLTDNEKKSYIDPVIFGSLSETTYPNGKGKVIYNGSEEGEFSHQFRIYMWIDSEYEQNEVSESFGFKVNLYAYNGEKGTTPPSGGGGAVDDLIQKVENGEDGIEGVDPETGLACIPGGDCKEYRYTGPTVKNYVKLKNKQTVDGSDTEELWRIIGIFTDSETGEKYMRIVRNEVLPEAMLPTNYVVSGTTYTIKSSGTNVYWNRITGTSSDKNNWATAGLQYYLNTEQDDDGSNKGYKSYLSEETKSFLEERTHYLGTYIYNKDTAVSGYQHERDVLSCADGKGATSSSSNFPVAGCNVWNGNDATWKGSISLMYPSDYGFSADKQYWTSTEVYNYDGGAKDTSWIYTTMTKVNFWTLSPSSTYSDLAMRWDTGGYVLSNLVSNFDYGARPVLNLKSQVKIKSGAGTSEDPYILEA